MIEWFRSGGFMMWPVLAAGLVAVWLAVDVGRKLVRDGEVTDTPRGLRGRIDAVLFWGGFAALVGFLGTLGGLGQVMRWLSEAGDAPAELIWSGLQVTLPTTVLGLVVLLLALAMWFGLLTLRRRHQGG